MTVAVGSKVGPYEIMASIGAGGMGEVWKARDTRLDRAVAIKFSKEQFSERFEREARAIAQLNHPHICTLHDVGPDYLVMEYLEGEALDARLKKGPMPLDQVMRLGAQIASALAAAHAKGIVHRDLKPGNIILTKSGAKVLDFGLARMPADRTITMANTVLGTPAYMAPEQREGRSADERADIYALGLLLREMATGKRSADLTGATHLGYIVENCLREAPEERWQSAADVQRLLEWSPPTAPPARSPFPWVMAIVAVALLAAGLGWYAAPRPTTGEPAEFIITIGGEDGTAPVPSPDGRLLAFRGLDGNGHPNIWLRPVNAITAKPLSGTEGAGGTIFWSPKGDWIGFHSAGAIKKVRATGGVPLTIAETSDLQDAAWNDQGDIIFRERNREPLQRVSDAGGRPQPLTKLNAALLENSHRFPRFLPGGRRFLFVSRCADRANNALYVGSLDTPEIKRVMFAESRAMYVNGKILYYRAGALVAQSLDLRTAQVSGDPQVIVPKVGYRPASIQAVFDVSADGSVIVASPDDGITSRLSWFDRSGTALGTVGAPLPYQQPRISPSGDRVLFQMPDPKTGNRDLMFIEVGRDIAHRLTNHPANDWYAVWSPDGKQVAFGSDRGDGRSVLAFLKTGLDQAAPEARIGGLAAPADWSKDDWIATGTGTMWVGSIKGGEPVKMTAPSVQEFSPRFSPDSKWLAYSSNESGRMEIYVRSFPGHPDPASRKIQISNQGGQFPMWNATGTELYYLTASDVVFAVDTRALDAGTVSAPIRLFKTCPESRPTVSASYTPPIDTRDGQRFLVTCLVDPPGQFTVLMNWAGLSR